MLTKKPTQLRHCPVIGAHMRNFHVVVAGLVQPVTMTALRTLEIPVLTRRSVFIPTRYSTLPHCSAAHIHRVP